MFSQLSAALLVPLHLPITIIKIMRLGAIEAGGTKMVCAIGDEAGTIEQVISIPTELPEITIPKMHSFFENSGIEALGIASFGPLDPRPESPTFGYITTTPKPGWKDYDLVGAFRDLSVPIGFDTDVNGSALGEKTFGAGRGFNNLVYITIGTGIGAGIVSEGRLLHGMLHPEAGHMILGRRDDDGDYVSFCPYHSNCFEGLCAGPAIEKRWGISAKELPEDHQGWDLEAYYIAQALINLTMVLSPERIILGGGVMHRAHIMPIIRKYFSEMMNGYINTPRISDVENFIVLQSLDDKQGILGALILGAKELGYGS